MNFQAGFLAPDKSAVRTVVTTRRLELVKLLLSREICDETTQG